MLTLPEKIVFAIVLLGAIGYFIHRIVTLVRLIRLGKSDPDNRLENLGARIVNVLIDVFLQRKVLRKPIVGLLHLLIVWGFFVFAVNTINHFAGAFIEGFHLFGKTKLALYYASMADLFAVLIIIGVLGLAFRRYVLRPESLTRPSPESVIVFTFLGGAMAAYLWANACEIALGMQEHPQYHFVSAFAASGLAGLSEGPMHIMAHVAWWCDALMHLVLVALVVIPTKHMHLAAGPLNLVLRRSRPRGQMSMMDLEDEEAESFGVSKIEDFTWKQNLDLYACIECGRCQDFCPTYNSDKPLNPKLLITDLKHYLLRHGPALLKRDRTNRGKDCAQEDKTPTVPALLGETVDKDAIWACTTCGACVEHCPMGIEHVDKLTDMRRYLVLMESDFPQEARVTFRNLETAGNPWGLAPTERADWAKGLDVPIFAEKKEAEVLYWVGCSGSYDDRNEKVSVDMVKILRAAGVDFAILGEEERCHCESARRLGNEYLYQMATQEIIETLKQYTFRRILVTCPHCFNTFANEYPEFGAKYEVIHHSQFINELIESGKLKLTRNAGGNGAIAFHDSCYLGRYNNIFAAPRRVLEAAGRKLVAVPREEEKSLCCGAGGGRMWLEENLGEQISTVRAKELIGTNAQQIATACPFCITMITDGIKSEQREDIQVKDIAEIIAESLERNTESNE